MHKHSNKIRKAVIPVAGRGTRMLPATKAVPKELLPIVDKPVLQFLVEEAVAAGIEEIVFVTSPGKDAIQKYFHSDAELENMIAEKEQKDVLAMLQRISGLAKYEFVTQSESLGDGHAILQARELIGDEPFLVLFGDELVFGTVSVAQQLTAVWDQTHKAVVALQRVEPSAVGNYGIVQPGRMADRAVEITGFVEKPAPADAPSDLAIVGKYICPPEIFSILEKGLCDSGEIRLIDALAELQKTESVTGFVFDGMRYDTGNKAGYVQAIIDYALCHPETKDAVQAHIDSIAREHRDQ